MTSVAAPRPRAAAWRAGPLVRVGRGVAALLVASLLLSGMAGGLLRAGVALPIGPSEALVGQAMTIAAERLEMTRLLRRRRGAQLLFFVILAALLLAIGVSAVAPSAGGLLYGAALLLLAIWLGVFDIARLTLHAHGLSRYMAVCLLGGYAWLALAGLAWAATAVGWPARDAALHALGLGFIFSMIMGHAPVILPAIARLKLSFGWPFYLPLALLHLGLLLRLAMGALEPSWRSIGAALNVVAIVWFALTVVAAALHWRFTTKEGLRRCA
ncbi:MAG: hypothetical protein AB3X44_00635 [Leptothrix sp. (in: b-proteobacteria)]